MNKLSPGQSADIVNWMFRHENKNPIKYGSKIKKSLTHVSLMATMSRYSPLPDGSPLLTYKEADEGVKFLQEQEKRDEDAGKIDRIVDTQNVSYHEARQRAGD